MDNSSDSVLNLTMLMRGQEDNISHIIKILEEQDCEIKRLTDEVEKLTIEIEKLKYPLFRRVIEWLSTKRD